MVTMSSNFRFFGLLIDFFSHEIIIRNIVEINLKD